MTLEERSREQLAAELAALIDRAGAEKHEHDRILHDLQVHQLELELQNRELREVQGALEQSRNRYADLYDFAPIAYFTFDAQGCVREVNLTGATLIGRERARLIGVPFVSLVELEDPARFWTHLRRCAEIRTPLVTELALKVGGVRVMLRAITSPVAGLSGDAIAFRTALIDVTDRHLAELARNEAYASEQILRRELELFGHAKLQLTNALATVTEDSLPAILQVAVDQARSIVDADYAALGIGTCPGARFDTWVFSGIDAQQVATIGPPPRVVGTLNEVVQHGALRLPDLTAHPTFSGLPAQHPAMTSFLGVPISFGARVVGNLYLTNKRGGREFSSDDQRCLESLARYVGAVMEIARLGDQAQGAIRSRDLLLATVSHDLRSPLSAITISSRLLLRMQLTSEEPLIRRQAETISRAALRMSRLIDDLLTASTIDAGQLSISTQPHRLEQIIAEAVDLLAFVAVENELQIGAKLPSELPEVTCDHDRIHQVLANLISNAVKFTPPGGRITVEATARGDVVDVSVIDTGPGIPEANLAHLFERYWKGDPATGRQGGVGLGLYICRGIVESHGGRIWVESRPGEGARFTFSIPIAGPPKPAALAVSWPAL